MPRAVVLLAHQTFYPPPADLLAGLAQRSMHPRAAIGLTTGLMHPAQLVEQAHVGLGPRIGWPW